VRRRLLTSERRKEEGREHNLLLPTLTAESYIDVVPEQGLPLIDSANH
jgi:hypothetical protein